jgi:hypothetical protein
MYYKRNIEARSRNHCYRGKAISTACSECLKLCCPTRMGRILFLSLTCLMNGTNFGKCYWTQKLFRFSLQILPETFSFYNEFGDIYMYIYTAFGKSLCTYKKCSKWCPRASILTSKSTYRSLSTQRLSERIMYVCMYILSVCLYMCVYVRRSSKVAGLIPDEVTGIFHWNHLSGRTMALGSTQYQEYFLGLKAAGA